MNTMNYVEHTESLIDKYEKLSKGETVIVFGPGYKIQPRNDNINIVVPDGDKDFIDWMIEYRNSPNFKPVAFCILSRVLEHIPVRQVDWFLYNLYTLLKKDADITIIIPDCKWVAETMEEEFAKPTPDLFRIYRLTFELLSEGENIWDRHALWCSPTAVKYYLQMEGLFSIDEINEIHVDAPFIKELEVIAHRN